MSTKIIKIGRSVDNEIIINNNSVSRHHCQLFVDNSGNVFLTDLNSSNGTYVNGMRIKDSVQLRQNDILKCGFSDPVPWRNYVNSDHNQSSYQNVITDNNSVYSHFNTNQKKSSTLKVVLITLSVFVVILGGGFILNELLIKSSKPSEIDPNKPNNTENQPTLTSEEKSISYDFSCLNDDEDMGTTDVVNVLEGIDSEITNVFGGDVSISDEEKVGNDLLRDCRNEYRFIEVGNQIKNLRVILQRLVDEIKEPKGFHYSIYLIESRELNAFTAGAKIFVTTRMYEFCQSNDELACVIGHEINHNELGHIKQHLQKSNILGEEGAALTGLFTIPFGQKKETHCDLKGIDLVIAAGYNGCVNVSLWRRMHQESQEGEYNAFENLFRSHPYSAKRSNCSQNHILNNYGFNCETGEKVK